MKLTLEPTTIGTSRTTITVSIPSDDLHIREAVEICRAALLSWGYQPSNIDEYFNDV